MHNFLVESGLKHQLFLPFIIDISWVAILEPETHFFIVFLCIIILGEPDSLFRWLEVYIFQLAVVVINHNVPGLLESQSVLTLVMVDGGRLPLIYLLVLEGQFVVLAVDQGVVHLLPHIAIQVVLKVQLVLRVEELTTVLGDLVLHYQNDGIIEFETHRKSILAQLLRNVALLALFDLEHEHPLLDLDLLQPRPDHQHLVNGPE